MHAMQMAATGGPEVLTFWEVPDPSPGPQEVMVQLAAAGINDIDPYRRSGFHPCPFPTAKAWRAPASALRRASGSRHGGASPVPQR